MHSFWVSLAVNKQTNASDGKRLISLSSFFFLLKPRFHVLFESSIRIMSQKTISTLWSRLGVVNQRFPTIIEQHSLLQMTLSLSLSMVRGKSAITAFFKEALLVFRLLPLNRPTSQFFKECLGMIFLFLAKSCWGGSHDTCTDSRDRHLKPLGLIVVVDSIFEFVASLSDNGRVGRWCVQQGHLDVFHQTVVLVGTH